MEDKKISPQEYFDSVKERKNHITDEQLKTVYDNCLELLNKYKITGQQRGIEKLLFHLECIEKEREIVALGFDTFIYRDDIEYYIDNVASAVVFVCLADFGGSFFYFFNCVSHCDSFTAEFKHSDVVKIINIENYEREIPDEIVSIISQTKDKFDQLYIVFTDYTGSTERRVMKERREKDPILFGTFQNADTHSVIDRFYYLGDWVDEYCDLTLDKMVNETQKVGKRNIIHTIKTPQDIEELKQQLNSLKREQNIYRMTNQPKNSFMDKIKQIFKRSKK